MSTGALSKRYAGAFSRPQELGPSLIDAGAASGERLWPFPMDPDFASALKSTVADILQAWNKAVCFSCALRFRALVLAS
jgi:leucyl aminopeptidase